MTPAPSSLPEGDFVERFGAIYEHSPWIARETWRRGLRAAHDTVDGLASALAATVENADDARKLALIRAHPDLGVVHNGPLTAYSSREQAGAGLIDDAGPELARLRAMNTAYRAKFGFPFVMAVKGCSLPEIMVAVERRLDNDAVTERDRALREIHRIARLRLAEMADRR